MSEQKLRGLRKAIIDQDLNSAVELTNACVKDGGEPSELIEAIAGALKEVGDLFECGELFLPEVMRAANAAKASLAIVLPLAAKVGPKEQKSLGRIALGSLGPHDIGKTIVGSTLIANGFDLLDLGICVTPAKVEEALKGRGTDILALSVLLTSDIEKAREIIAVSRAALPRLRVMVGGAAMNEKVAKRIGSDAYGIDANESVRLAKRLLGVLQ